MNSGRKTIFFLTVLILIFTVSAAENMKNGSERRGGIVIEAVIDGPIIPVTGEYIEAALETAERRNAECVLVKLNTPGGGLKPTYDIISDIMNSAVPVVIYVAPRGAGATSAGTFITIAGHIAAMSPATNIGAAHPVTLDGKGVDEEEQKELTERLKEILEESQKAKEEAEKESELKETPEEGQKYEGEGVEEVEEAESATPLPEQPGSEKEQEEKAAGSIMSQKVLNDTVAKMRAIAELRGRNADWAESAIRESVSITAETAVELNVVDLMADNTEDLLKKIDGMSVVTDAGEKVLHTANAETVPVDLTWRQRFLAIISDPSIVYVLLSLGSMAIMIEIFNPGLILPGVIGAISVIVAAYGIQLLPVNYSGLLLMFLAFVLFVLEVKVQSFGLLTIAGIVSLFLGSVMLFDSPLPFMRVSYTVILPVVIGIGIVAFLLIMMIVKSHSRKSRTGYTGLIGETGEAITDLNPKGKVFAHGEIWNATADEHVEKGVNVEILGVDKMTLHVAPRK